MNRDEFFQNLFGENTPSADAIRARRQLAYEERVIKRILTRCGAAPASWGMLVNQCRRESHEDKLNFRWFNQAYRGFPGRLCGKRIPYLHEITLPDLFKPVGKNKLFKRIGKALGELEISPLSKQPFVFTFALIKTPMCAYNSAKVGEDLLRDSQRLQFVFYPMEAGHRPVYIEPLDTFCAALGNEWAIE